ncbi:MAG TPA: isopentenyl-diphosphate Delta-isomerase [Candidatus Woesebacteria bacterium]|nr:isopentenyl-diphosphate Delta-isomerase [Candidatus Woesebacteria bacterium]HNS65109.1 isopentenyl-diphosphate Delta-isomerase [Candidatus Woesebacteria bacterium]
MLDMNKSDQCKQMESGNETIMLVDSIDTVIGEIGKIEAHQKAGRLHRAFTIFLQNQKDEWLITKRSEQKPLWPLWWDAACSSHPWFPNETIEQAALRRLPFELGLHIKEVNNVRVVGTYEYHAVYSPEWSENEINHIVVANYDGELLVNPNEVSDFKWLAPSQIDERLTQPNLFSPWFAQAWQEVK